MDRIFKDIVQKALDAGLLNELARAIRLPKSTIERWANGVANPAPYIKDMVMEIIDRLILHSVDSDTHHDPKK